MTILCTVDLETREVALPSGQRIASYDHNVDVIRFQAETIPGFSLNTSTIKIAAQGPNKARHDYAVDPSTVAIEEETGYITFDWPIPAGVTEMPIGTFKYGDKGSLIFAVCAEIIDGSTVSKAWHSDDGIITVVAHLEPESGGGEDPEEEATNAQKIAQLQTNVAVMGTQISALGNGSPTPVATVAEMTDESAVYLYTGSESGYTAGNWYYWNGSAWTSGGTYGGAVTDTTLTIEGAAADAKAVGDAIDALDDRVTALESGSSGGLTADIKSALLACFANVAWINGDGRDFYDALDAALNPPANLSSITCVYTQSGTVYDTASLDDLKPDLVVTAHYSDSTSETVTVYNLSGTLAVGTSTITASYGGKTTTFAVTVTQAEATLQSISAVFNQGSVVIYENSSLESLKPYLTVTARYSDSTTQTVTNYTLSGTLKTGTSTITASYGGKTTTFNVTVTERATPPTPSTNPIYTLTTPATFNGTSDHIDTEMQLIDSNKKNITIVGDLLDKSNPAVGNPNMLFHCMHEVSPYPGITIQMNPATDTEKYFVLNVNSNSASGGYGDIKTTGIPNNESEGIREKFAAIINNQNSTFTLVGVFNGTYFSKTKALPPEYNSTEITETTVIGARKKINDGTAQYDHYWKGTIYDLKIYDYSWDKTEADNYVNGGNS